MTARVVTARRHLQERFDGLGYSAGRWSPRARAGGGLDAGEHLGVGLVAVLQDKDAVAGQERPRVLFLWVCRVGEFRPRRWWLGWLEWRAWAGAVLRVRARVERAVASAEGVLRSQGR